MNHPVFGEIKRDKELDWWVGQAQLPSFREFDETSKREWEEKRMAGWKMPKPTKEEAQERELFKAGYFEMIIRDDPGDGPSPAQEKAFHYLLENQDTICRNLAAAVLKYYRKQYDELKAWHEQAKDPEYLEAILPDVNVPEAMKRLIRLNSIDIHDNEDKGVSHIGYAFGCTWDIEHGLGVLMRKEKVIEVGQADTALG